MATYGGWTGKTLRVDLTTGKITVEDTIAKYKDFLGGTGVGYKVLWDEVPAGTKAFDPANKIIFGVGPLTGTGAPCGGRTSITTIFPTSYPHEAVGTGHMGGTFGSELKYAGWDNVIIEGKAPKPVFLSIIDDQVEIRDAAHLWGNGIYRATEAIAQEMGGEGSVAAIGQAGENMVRMAVVMNGYSHSAGGVGGVLGSKNLKAIAVKGTGSVKIAGDKKAWKELNHFILSIIGANNNHCVPSTPQPWAEYSAATRWTARKGLYWGAANPPIETGECPAGEINKMGYRTAKATFDMGPLAEKFHVRQGGCTSCPIRCMVHMDVPSVEAKYGLNRYAANTCAGWPGKGWFKSFPDGAQGLTSIEANIVGKHMADDYGIWCNYGQLQRDFKWAYYSGLMKQRVPEKEWKEIDWAAYEKGDPAFLMDIYKRIAFKIGEIGQAFGEGSGRWIERWKPGKEYFEDHDVLYWGKGTTKHHSSEDAYQVGVLTNLIYNRDAQIHSISNFTRNGLPLKVQKAVAAKFWGAEAVESNTDCKPFKPAMAAFAKFGLLRKELHDSLTLCNWMWPFIASPLKSRGYVGDITLEAQLYSMVTGDQKTMEELDLVAERIFNLHRALTIRDWNTVEMREQHDVIPPWIFDYPEDKPAFTPGHSRMDRADMEIAKDSFYEQLGWDKKTGAPTRATLERLGLKAVADELAKKGLLPA
ncbi:MAG: aldehyde ferredoxin oxidoreductase [Chitinophagales bacterium]